MEESVLSLVPEKAVLLSSLSTLSQKIASAVKQAKADFITVSDVYEFMSTRNKTTGIQKLFVIVSLYIECFQSVRVKTRTELEKLWAKYYDDQEVRGTVEELLDNEESVEKFAAEVDKELSNHESKSNPPAKIGQALPKSLVLTDVETGEETPLENYWKESKFTWFVFLRHFG
jgi:hypothetical protein